MLPRIRTYILVSLSAVAGTTTGVVGLAEASRAEAEGLANAQQHLRLLAGSVGSGVGELLAEEVHANEAAAELIAGARSDDAERQRLLDIYRDNSDCDMAVITDGAFHGVMSSPQLMLGRPATGASYADRGYVGIMARTGHSAIGGVERGKRTHRLTVHIASPLPDPSGRHAAILSSLRLQPFGALARRIVGPVEGARAAVLDHNGRAIVDTAATDAVAVGDAPVGGIFAWHRLEHVVLRGVDDAGRDVLGATSAIRDARTPGWRVVVTLPEEPILAAAAHLRARALRAAGLVLLVSLLVSLPLSGWLAGPVRALADLVTAFGEGRPGAVGRLAPRRVRFREAAELERAVLDMMASIEANRHDLERRVAERTEELSEKARELEEARRRAEGLADAKSRLLATLSHELRSPMNGIIGTLDLLGEAPLSSAHAELAAVAQRSSRALLGLLDQVLDATRLETDKLDFEAVPFDLPRAVADVATLFGPAAADKGVALTSSVAATVPRWVSGDETRVRQLLHNLVHNAVKFTHAGSIQVGASAERVGSDVRVTLTVTDTGVGIPADRCRVIFEEFEQADASTTRRFGGSGLGLFIARELCRRMGGDVDVVTSVGRGSTFTATLALPVAEAPAVAEAAPSAPIAVAPAAERPRVLLVEDDAINRLVSERLLARLGVDVDTVEDGASAVDRASARDYDLVLMDCQMPEMDGFEATQRIRGLDGARGRTPVVALTANGFADDRARCLAAGMDEHVSKPITIATMRRIVTRWAGSRG